MNQLTEIELVNKNIDDAIALLKNDRTGKYRNTARFGGNNKIVPNCIVYAVGSILPIGASTLPSDKIKYGELYEAYRAYNQMCDIAQQMAQGIIYASTTPLYYHDGRKFVKITAQKVIDKNCPTI